MKKAIKTNWGTYYLGDKVKISKEGRNNDNYEEYFNDTLIINFVDVEDDGLGKIEPIMSFELLDGTDFPFSLYGYEIRRIRTCY